MARVEITHNIGPEVFNSVSKTIAAGQKDFVSEPIDVKYYTLHSYQVLSDIEEIDFTIIASNISDEHGNPSLDFENDWTVISSHSVAPNVPFGYSDIWNFNFSAVIVKNFSDKDTTVKVFEKHNA